MKKRLLVLLLVVALAVTVSMFTASAETNWDAHVCPICGGDAIAWTPLPVATANAQVLAPGHYYVQETVTNATKYFSVTGKVCIDLNGNTYARTGQGAIASVTGSGELNIMDNSGTHAGVLQTENAYTSYAGLIQVWSGAKVNLYGGTLRYSGTLNNSAKGGTVYVGSGAEFTMYDGIIEGGHAKQGGNVYIEGGRFTLKDGIIRNGVCAGATYSNGGNINNAGGTFIMEDGTISGGNAGWIGGNLRNAGTATITGGEIVGGQARSGGNVVAYSGSVTMSNVTIKNGYVKQGDRSWDCGANFYHEGGTVTMNAGTNLLIEDSHDATLTDKKDADGNVTAAGNYVYYGANLIVVNGTFTMNGGAITGGKAAQGGGAVAVVTCTGANTGTGKFVLNDGTVSNGYSRYGAGNIDVRQQFEMTGGTVSGGTTASGTASKMSASDVGVNGIDATVTISGGTIAGGLDLGPANTSDTTYINNDGITISGTAKIGKLVMEDTQRINLGEFSNGANVKVIFGTGTSLTNSGTIANIGDKRIRDYAPYIKCAGAFTTYGIGLGLSGSDLIMGTTDAQINPQNKALGETTMMNYTDIRQALAEVDAATEMIYLKNVNSGDNADDRRTYTEDIAIDEDIIIDLNGVEVTGTFNIAKDKTLTLVDVEGYEYLNAHANDEEYKLSCFVTVGGEGKVATLTQHPCYNGKYIVLVDENNKATVHYYSLKISAASIKPDTKGVYFGAKLSCDPILRDAIDDFGVETNLKDKSYVYTTRMTDTSAWNNGVMTFNGVEITGVVSDDAKEATGTANGGAPTNQERAEWDIHVVPYMNINVGENVRSLCVKGATNEMSMTDVLYLMDEKWDQVYAEKEEDTPAMKLAIQKLYMNWKSWAGWKDCANLTIAE